MNILYSVLSVYTTFLLPIYSEIEILQSVTPCIECIKTATAVLKGQIKFDWGANASAANWFTNLKWKLMDSAAAVTVASGNVGTTATKSWANFATSVSLAPSGTKQYWIIIWIEETGSAQNTTYHISL